MKRGKVFLIGAGPGDIELLTLKAVQAIQGADVLLMDALVNPDILQFARQGAEVIHVGKRGGCKSTPQSLINQQMIDLAQAGKSVARIKGGDPFIFGRGGEEVEALSGAGIEIIVIPGVTSGLALPAVLGIPLTHRDHACGVTIVAGHRRESNQPDWQHIARSNTTLVIYMGISNLNNIVRELLASGMSPSMPAAAVQNCTLPDQREVVTTLEKLPEAVSCSGLESPAVIVIGTVVMLSPQLNAVAAPDINLQPLAQRSPR